MEKLTPAPNRGAAVPDSVAAGAEHKSLADWRSQAGIETTTQIKLVKLSHMRYRHPDLEKITEFLLGESIRAPDRKVARVY